MLNLLKYRLKALLGLHFILFIFPQFSNAEEIFSPNPHTSDKNTANVVTTTEDSRQRVVVGNKVESGNESPINTDRLVEIRIFHDIADVMSYTEELYNKGLEAEVQTGVHENNEVFYKVFARRPKDKKEIDYAANTSGKEPLAATLADEVKNIKPKEKDIDEQKLSIATLPTVAGKKSESVSTDTPINPSNPVGNDQKYVQAVYSSESSTQGSVAQEQGENKSSVSEGGILSGDVFGAEGGYIHPFVHFRTYFTDNVYNTRDDKKSDFAYVITPGVWLTVPRIREQLLHLDSRTVSPSGLRLSRLNPGYFKRYQTYLYYGADIEQFASHTSENMITHRLEGLLEYNLKGGLTFELIDRFLLSRDARGTGISTELDKFKSNLAGLIIFYDTRRKTMYRFDYTHYWLDYDASRNNFRDRHDNTLSGYVFYKIAPKTSLFVQYEFIDISYDYDSLSDSKEHHYWGGVDWNITAKTFGRLKVGYAVKNFARSTIGDSHDMIFEAQIDYKFTPKTSMILKAFRKTQETNITETDYMITSGIRADYLQRLTGKLLLSAKLGYWNELYRRDLDYNNWSKQREDNIWEAGLMLGYNLKEWLKLELGYLYENRNSSFDEFDYVNNTYFLGLNGEFSVNVEP